jgi:quercetin dioxygenase-like cupin family protein
MVGQLHLFGVKRQTVMRHIVQEDFAERDSANQQEFHSRSESVRRTQVGFERRFCGALLLLIVAIVVMVSVFLTHLSDPLGERFDGHVAIDSANGAGQEKPMTLQPTAVAAWLNQRDFLFTRLSPFLNRHSINSIAKEETGKMKLEDRQMLIDEDYPQANTKWLETRPGEHCLIRISAKDTHGLYSLVEILSDPGDGTPMHIHESEDEQIVVLEGTARIAYGDKVFDAHVGDVVTLRKGIPHAWGNRSSAQLRIAVLASPGGVEEILDLIAKSSPADIPAIAERFHVRNIGPTPF